jgi:hypothetical protein
MYAVELTPYASRFTYSVFYDGDLVASTDTLWGAKFWIWRHKRRIRMVENLNEKVN